MGLLDQPTRIIGLGGRALGAGVSAALKELRGGEGEQSEGGQPQAQQADGQGQQADGQGQQPSPQAQRDEQARQQTTRRQSSRKPKDLDDVTIARKVESELFRGEDRHALKAHIDVNVVDGDVYLRGVAKTPQLIKQLEAEAKAIPEVKGVENLLHLPNTPAPTRTDTPARQRKTRTSAPRKPRTEPRSLNADKTVQQSGDLPETLAKEGKGRQPAPLGSHGEGSDESAAPAPEDFSGRFRRQGDEDPVAGRDPGTEQPATTRLGTEGGPAGGGGEVVH